MFRRNWFANRSANVEATKIAAAAKKLEPSTAQSITRLRSLTIAANTTMNDATTRTIATLCGGAHMVG